MALIKISKLPPKKADASQPKVKKIALTKKVEALTEPLSQKFFISHSKDTLSVKFFDQSFGIKKENDRLSSFMRNTDKKENVLITEILDLIKKYIKSGLSFEQVAKRLAVGEFSQTIRVFKNALNKPYTEAPAPTLTINEHADATPEHLHI